MAVIGLDIDGTLFDVLSPVLEEYNGRHNTNFKPDDVTDYKVHQVLNIDYDEFYEILNYIWINQWQSIKPYEPFTDNYLNRLRNGNKNQVVIVTKRDLKTISNVVNLLKKWRIKIDGLICVNNSLEKTMVTVDLLLDDSKEVTDSFGNRGFLIKRPYNKVYDVESIREFATKIRNGTLQKKMVINA